MPGMLVRLERLRLAARPVQREHELAAQTLAKRIAPYERLELGGERGVSTQRQIGVDAILERREAALLESCDLRLGEVGVGEVREGGATPESQCLAEERRGRPRVAVVQPDSTGVGQLLEFVDVQGPGPRCEPVAARYGLERAVAERLSQPGHVHLKRLGGVARW